MKIKPSELHFSEKVLDEFEQLREALLVLFSLDKHITDRQEEHGLIQENNTELNALKVVYDKSVQLQDHKNQEYRKQNEMRQKQQY